MLDRPAQHWAGIAQAKDSIALFCSSGVGDWHSMNKFISQLTHAFSQKLMGYCWFRLADPRFIIK